MQYCGVIALVFLGVFFSSHAYFDVHHWQLTSATMSVKILFFVARRHYELQLMRHVYQEWHEMWWELRKEWRLMVRAECHHRYEAKGQRFFVYLSFKAIYLCQINSVKLYIYRYHSRLSTFQGF